MHPGQISNISCPSDLEYGGAHNKYSDFGS